MLCSPSVAVKGPFRWSGCISLLLFTFSALFFSLISTPSEASLVGSSSFKSLESRFHPNSFPSTCAAPHLSSLSCEAAPWYSNEFTPLPLTPSFTSNCADYSITRPFAETYSVLRVHIGAAIPVDAQVTVVLNGVVIVTPILSASIDLFISAGINVCEIHVAVGTCITIYTIKINVAVLVVGEILPPFPNCNSCPPTNIDSFSLALTAAGSATLVPLVCTPPFDIHGSHDFIAYEGVTVFVGGNIHLHVNFAVGLWIRYSINNGIWVYVAVSGLEIVAALQVGTNLIRVDVIKPGPCGNEIVEYTFTICEGPPPPAPLPAPSCPPLELISLDLKGCISLLGIVQSIIPIPIAIEVGLFDYVVIRPLGVTLVKLLVTVDVDVAVNVYLNGVIVAPHPVPAGVVLDLNLAIGVNLIKIDLIKGGCITHYTCTIN